MPNSTHDPVTRAVRKGGKRFYIVKDHDRDQAVVRTVPVGVCAAPPRVVLADRADGNPGPTGSVSIPVPTDAVAQPGPLGRVRRVRDVVRRPLGQRPGR